MADKDVMDYSLLVGVDEVAQELVVGVIDYIRTFTWDKKLEMYVKQSGILGGQGNMPTVVSPVSYQQRFRDAMERYFWLAPNRWDFAAHFARTGGGGGGGGGGGAGKPAASSGKEGSSSGKLLDAANGKAGVESN